MRDRLVTFPRHDGAFALRSAHVPACCLEGVDPASLAINVDGLALVNIVVRDGRIDSIEPAGALSTGSGYPELDVKGKMVLPTFADLHTHVGEKGGNIGREFLRCGVTRLCKGARRRGLYVW